MPSSRFVSDAGQVLKPLKGVWYYPSMLLHQDLQKCMECMNEWHEQYEGV